METQHLPSPYPAHLRELLYRVTLLHGHSVVELLMTRSLLRAYTGTISYIFIPQSLTITATFSLPQHELLSQINPLAGLHCFGTLCKSL